MSGSPEIATFLRKKLHIQLQFFTNEACTAFNWVLLVTKKNLRIAVYFPHAPIPFLTYLCIKRLKPSMHCSIMKKNSTDSAGIEQSK